VTGASIRDSAGGFSVGTVRAIALQPDGRILIGVVPGVTRLTGNQSGSLLPRTTATRYASISRRDQTFAAATFPPATNYLRCQRSQDLADRRTNTSPYIFHLNFSVSDAPQAFFRASKTAELGSELSHYCLFLEQSPAAAGAEGAAIARTGGYSVWISQLDERA